MEKANKRVKSEPRAWPQTPLTADLSLGETADLSLGETAEVVQQ